MVVARCNRYKATDTKQPIQSNRMEFTIATKPLDTAHSNTTHSNTAHSKSVLIKQNIQTMHRQIHLLSNRITEQTLLLEETCPHKDTTVEYDDDFHKPRSYVKCKLCECDVR